ncbi:pilus assembly protein [Corallincola platygyrae]|uniref:Pilus assembly protein n=1 Tax=Corallincola platygyrae TaxID=1193278 RepID=A0ABW4XQY5_9GAMM
MKLKQLGILLSSALAVVTALHTPSSVAEDTELFIREISSRTGYSPKVMVIFDNSGSMAGTIEVKEGYDPTKTYEATGADNSLSFDEDDFRKDFIYWRKGSLDGGAPPVPDGPNEQNRFNFDTFNCHQAEIKLREKGYFTGYIREYRFSGQSGSWLEMKENSGADTNNPIDCLEDISAGDPTNNGGAGYPSGYPIDGQGKKQNPIYYSDTIQSTPANGTHLGNGEPVTLYMANYLKWYHNEDIQKVNQSKLQIAKESINQVISSTLTADFGLSVFNMNNSQPQGGRIVKGIPDGMTNAQRETLTDTIADLNATTWTPLCETMYEVKRYFAGEAVVFSDVPNNLKEQPYSDTSIWSGGNYVSPYGPCSDKLYVILVTDGEPTRDGYVNTTVANLPISGDDAVRYPAVEGNYLPALTGWMHTQDINGNPDDGKQTAQIYTVGFGDVFTDADDPNIPKSTKILLSAAQNGGGQYYKAGNAQELTSALQDALMKILANNASLTSPAVATSSFDRTEVLDVLFYSIFKSSKTTRWQGNLKKLKLSGSQVIDADDGAALDAKGGIAEGVSTYWGGDKDGPDVAKGGVIEMLYKKTDRKVLTDLGDGGLIELTPANVLANATAEELATLGGDDATITANVNWMLGLDVDDDVPNSDYHEFQFGDPLHSRPVAVNYGGENEGSQDLRVLIGTNYGFLHMFKDVSDDEVDESWAFAPRELFDNYALLRDNLETATKVYGMDGTATIYTNDADYDGQIDPGEDVWAFTGMRRGGNSYYGMDLSSPDSPKKMWQITGGDGDFLELGQSWSKPTIAFLRAHGAGKPVLIFGAGYDINKDLQTVGTDDNVGMGVFIVDAKTGALIWKFTSSESGGKNTQIVGITDSIPAEVAVMDSDYDGFADRIYAPDTGGNLWRIDIPTDSLSDASAFKLATLGGDISASDRRFFVKPVVARSLNSKVIESTDLNNNKIFSEGQIPIDFVTIGSGNVSHPLDNDTQDMFFLIRDTDVLPLSKDETRKRTAITLGELFDQRAYNQLVASANDDEAVLSLRAQTDGKSGCYIDYPLIAEKSLSPARIIEGVVLHSGFTPPGNNAAQCEPALGQSILYADGLCDIRQESVSYDAVEIPSYNPPTAIIVDGELKIVTASGVKEVPELKELPEQEQPPCDPNTQNCDCDPAVQDCGGDPVNLPFDAVIKAQSGYREDI